jgi:hypothetical protein
VRRARSAGSDLSVFAEMTRGYSLEWAFTTSVEGESQDVSLARSPEWTMIYLDDVAAVYVRNDGPNAKLAAGGYRALRHHIRPAEIIQAAAGGGEVSRALWHDGALALSQAPSSPRASFLAAAGGIAVSDRDLFERGIASLGRLAPGNPSLGLLRRAWDERAAR